MARVRYESTDKAWAKEKLLALQQTLDSIPYTSTFDQLYDEFNTTQLVAWTRPDFWKLMLAIRKQGLGGMRRARIEAPKLNAKQQARLKDLMPKNRGEIDRLPYTSDFNRLYSEFSKYFSTPLTKRELWLACLHIAKAAIKKPAKPLLEKAIRRVRAGINAFNRIGGANRLDDALITIHHAMEMILKAGLLQHIVPVIDRESGHYLQFKPCLRMAVHDDKAKFLSQEDRQVLLAIDAARGDAYHGLLELDEAEAYAMISSAIEIFQKILWEVFWKDLADSLGSMVLPISTIPLASSVMLLDRKDAQIKQLLAAGDDHRALGAARSLAILEKASQGLDDVRVTESEVKDTLKRIGESESMPAAFPGIAGLPVTQTDSGATIFIAVRRSGSSLHANETTDDEHGPVIAVDHRDYRDTHPFRFNDVKDRVGLTQHRLRGIIAELKLKESPDCYHEHGPAKGQKTPGYSQKAVSEIKKFVESYDGDLLDLYRKHVMKKKRPR